MQLKQFGRLVAVCCITLLAAIQANAQEGGNASETPKEISLSPKQLKAYEGIFQSAQNKEMNVQFTADSNSLDAKLLWNGGQIRIFPQSELAFFSKEGERVSLTFVKGTDGTITQVNVGGNGLWNRVNNYKPLTKQEIPHTPEQLKIYEGLYENASNNGMYLQFTEKDNMLVLKQQWDGQQVQFVPDSAWRFFNKQQLMFTLDFKKDANGNVTKVVAFGRDVWNKTKPAHYTHGDLKAFEGKYQLKVDNDDLIQISASGDNLVVKQLWDGKETIVNPMAELYFYNAAENYPLKFTKSTDGTITQATALNGDEFERIKK